MRCGEKGDEVHDGRVGDAADAVGRNGCGTPVVHRYCSMGLFQEIVGSNWGSIEVADGVV